MIIVSNTILLSDDIIKMASKIFWNLKIYAGSQHKVFES